MNYLTLILHWTYNGSHFCRGLVYLVCPCKQKFRAMSRSLLQLYCRYIVQIYFPHVFLRSVVVITTAQLHSSKSELRFCTGSNPAGGVTEIHDGEFLWQWFWLAIRLNAFCQWTIPQKQFVIIIIISFHYAWNQLQILNAK